jgi:hypothetical protein
LLAVLLAASAVAHAVLGWPPFKGELTGLGLEQNDVEVLAVAWYFGSVAMAMLAAIAWHIAKRLRAGHASFVTLRIIGAGYLAYGAWAFVYRHFNPHLLGFMGIGVLGLVAGWPETSRES